MAECQICCERFNKSTKAPITCEYSDCGYVVCKSCVRTYLTTTSADPCCMRCNKQFSMVFMYKNLNRSFVSKEYRNHRSQLLLHRAMSQLPDAMCEVERRVNIEKKKQEVQQIHMQLLVFKRRLRQQQTELRQMKTPQCDVVKRKFVMGCQKDDCRGFLSSQYICGLCNYHTCEHCLFVKGPTVDSEHTCNPGDIASADLIKAETKSCPSCGERIFKIEGCDQMWCTSCNTAFSWRSGEIDTGVVHNPHFFEWQRQHTDIKDGRGLGQCNADNMPGNYLIRGVQNLINQHGSHRVLGTVVAQMYLFIIHVREHQVTRYRHRIRTLNNTMNIRVDYIMKRLNKQAMERQLYTNDRLRQRYTLILNLLELIGDVGKEFVWGLCNSTDSSTEFVHLVQDEVNQINELFDYCNREWAKISYDHRITVPVIEYRDGLHIVKRHVYKEGKAAGISTYEEFNERSATFAGRILSYDDEKYHE